MRRLSGLCAFLFFSISFLIRVQGQSILEPTTFQPKKGTSVTLSSPTVIEPYWSDLLESKVSAFNAERRSKDTNNESKLSVHVGVVRLRGYVQHEVTPELIDQVDWVNKNVFKVKSEFVLPRQKQKLAEVARDRNADEIGELLRLTEKRLIKQLDDFQVAEGKTERVCYLVTLLEYIDPSDNKIHRIERHSTSFKGRRLDLLQGRLKKRIVDQKIDNLQDDNTSLRGTLAYGGVVNTLKALNELYDEAITDYKFCGKTTSEWAKQEGITVQEQQRVAGQIADRLDDPNFDHDYYSYPAVGGKSKQLIPDPGLFRSLTRTSLFDQEMLPDLLNGLNAAGKCDYEVLVAYQAVEKFIPEEKRGKLAEEVYLKSTRLSKSNKKAILFVVPYMSCSGGGDGINLTIYLPGVYGPDPQMNTSMNAALVKWGNDFEKGFREAISYIPHDVEVHYAEIQLQGDYIYSGLKTYKRATGLIAQDVGQVYITQDSRFDLIMAAYIEAVKQCDNATSPSPVFLPVPGYDPTVKKFEVTECMRPKLSQILSATEAMGKVGIRVADLNVTNKLIRSKLTEEVVKKLVQSYISQRLPVAANIDLEIAQIKFGEEGIDKGYFYNNKSPLPATTWFDKTVYTVAEIGTYIPLPFFNEVFGVAGTLYALHAGHDDKTAYFAMSTVMPYAIVPIIKGAFVGGKYLLKKSDGLFIWIETRSPSLFRSSAQTSQYLESLLQPRTYAVVVSQKDKVFTKAVEDACNRDARTMVAVDDSVLNGFLKSGLPKNGDALLRYVQGIVSKDNLPAVISLGESDLISEAAKRFPINTGALDVLFHLDATGQITMTLHDGATKTLPIGVFIEQLGIIKSFQESPVVRLTSCTQGGNLNEVARQLSIKYPDKKILALVSENPAKTGIAKNGETVVLQGGKVTEAVFVNGKMALGKTIRSATTEELADGIVALGKDIQVVSAGKAAKELPFIEMEGLKIYGSLGENLVCVNGKLAKDAKGELIIRSHIPGVGPLNITMDDLMVKIKGELDPTKRVAFMLTDPGDKALQIEFLREITTKFRQEKLEPPTVKLNKEQLPSAELSSQKEILTTTFPMASRDIEWYTIRPPGGFIVDIYKGKHDVGEQVFVYTNGTNAILGVGAVTDGVFNAGINIKIPENTTGITGRQVFNAMYEQLEATHGKITGIEGNWSRRMSTLQDNVNSFNNEILKIIAREKDLHTKRANAFELVEEEVKERAAYEAAAQTFTGKMAKEKGFCCVTHIAPWGGRTNEDGSFDAVTVLFSNTKGPYSTPLVALTSSVEDAIKLAQKGFKSSHPIELQHFKETLQRKIIEASSSGAVDYANMLNTNSGWVQLAYQDMVTYGVRDFNFATFADKMELIKRNKSSLEIFNKRMFDAEGGYKSPDRMKDLLELYFINPELKSNELVKIGLSDKASGRAWLLTENYNNATVGEHSRLSRFDLRLEEALMKVKDSQKRDQLIQYFNRNIDQINQVYREMNLFDPSKVDLEILAVKWRIFDLFRGSSLEMHEFEKEVFKPLGGHASPVSLYKDLLADLESLGPKEFEYIINDLGLIKDAIDDGEPLKKFLSTPDILEAAPEVKVPTVSTGLVGNIGESIVPEFAHFQVSEETKKQLSRAYTDLTQEQIDPLIKNKIEDLIKQGDAKTLADYLSVNTKKTVEKNGTLGDKYNATLHNRDFDKDFPQTPQRRGEKPIMLNAEERKKYELSVKNGELYRGNAPLPKKTNYLFVLSPKGELYAARSLEMDGPFFHSSFFSKDYAKGEVHLVSAGEIQIVGEILYISNRSGHYKPPLGTLLEVVRELGALGYKVKNIKLVDEAIEGQFPFDY